MCAALMLRRLLACLALLTGLTAAGAPAQAEMAIAMASRMETAACRDQAPRQAKVTVHEATPGAEFADCATAEPRGVPACRHSTVQLRSDRARE